jgi:hypothetical protein
MKLRRLKGWLAVGTLAAGVVALARCGGYSTKVPTPLGSGVLLTEVGDAPVCDVLSFRVLVSSLTLFQPNSSFPITVFPGRLSSAPNIRVNLDSVRDTPTILNLSAVPAVEYDRASIGILLPQVDIYDPTKSPPTSTLSASLSRGSVPITFNPPLSITKNQLSVLLMDFDLKRSFEVDANGQLTGRITPVVSLIPLSATAAGGYGEMDDIVGFVSSVNPNITPGSPFYGSISLQLLSGTGPVMAANFTQSTALYGATALNQVTTDSFVEMDGYVDTRANLVANTVEVEGRASQTSSANTLTFLGIVTSLTKDTSGNVLQFTLLNREEEPDESLFLPLDQNLVVNVSPTTSYQYSSRASNFVNLPFGPSSLSVGQEMVVHGAFKAGSGINSTTVQADKIYLKLQTHEGNFNSLVAVNADDKTGAFWLQPCGSIFQNAPILVITGPSTNYVNVIGLNNLTPLPSLLVKGLLFFEVAATTISGVNVPAGTLVLVAKQVHQLS